MGLVANGRPNSNVLLTEDVSAPLQVDSVGVAVDSNAQLKVLLLHLHLDSALVGLLQPHFYE